MELDDLKHSWKSTHDSASSDAVRQLLEQKLPSLASSGRGIRRAFVIEMSVVLVMYIVFFFLIREMSDRLMSFMYKIVGLTTVVAIPISWRLYKSQRLANTLDFGRDIRTNVIQFLTYYEKSLKMYKWGTYGMVILMFFVFYFDSDFSSLPLSLKLLVFGYLTVVILVTAPYVNWVYGRKMKAFQRFLEE